MNEGKAGSSGEALISLLKSMTATEGAHTFVHLVLYTGFGVVRGRTGLSLLLGAGGRESSEPGREGPHEGVIELHEVTVEHYSNHLPTAGFDRLYVPFDAVQGFAVDGSQKQG
jgi:hypothetical protein